jgi:hypothetical protein
VRRAYAAATACFEDVLPGLVAELAALKQPVAEDSLALRGPVARRMAAACRAHRANFVTPMAAVAGAVADHVLAVMTAAADLTRAYVNDGGDIALHLMPGESLACGMVAEIRASMAAPSSRRRRRSAASPPRAAPPWATAGAASRSALPTR